MLVTIKIKGQLRPKWEDWFDNMKIEVENGYTILSGKVPDQPALHGILNKIRDLNLELISLKRETICCIMP